MKLSVFYDYTCPFCYLGVTYLYQLLPNYPEIELEYHPCEAHPYPEEKMTITEEMGFWRKGILPAAEEAEIPIIVPFQPLPYSSRSIQGFFYLKEHDGDLTAYNKAVYHTFYVDGKDIHDIDVVVDDMVKAGADRVAAKIAIQEGTYLNAVLEANRFAYEDNAIEAIPTYIAGETELRSKLGYGVTKEDVKNFLDTITKK